MGESMTEIGQLEATSEHPTVAPNVESEPESLDVVMDFAAFRAWIQEIAVQSDECRIKVDVDGLHVRVVDPAHICMLETTFAANACGTYVMSWPGSMYAQTFGMDVDKVLEFLKGAPKGIDSEISVHVNMDKMSMTLVSSIGSRTMKLLDDEGMLDPNLPTIQLDVVMWIESGKELKRALVAASNISDVITIRYDSKTNQAYLESESDSDRFQVPIGRVDVQPGKDAISHFPLEYLLNIVKQVPGSLELEIGTDYPLRIMHGQSTILLAPRIESDQ